MNKEEALDLLHSLMQNSNLRKHCYAVAAAMKALALKFKADENMWEIVGLLHDADYEMFKNDPKKHPSYIIEELIKRKVDAQIIQAIKAHAWGWRPDLPEPKTPMEWAVYTVDELTGLIIACALVRPDKKLSSVTVETVLKKWHVKAFAAGVYREQIELCETKLHISLNEFIQITLKSMQDIHDQLGL